MSFLECYEKAKKEREENEKIHHERYAPACAEKLSYHILNQMSKGESSGHYSYSALSPCYKIYLTDSELREFVKPTLGSAASNLSIGIQINSVGTGFIRWRFAS